MSKLTEPENWRFVKFGLLVTGVGEQTILPSLLRALCTSGHGTFQVIRKIGQRSPITSRRRELRMVGSGKQIPDRDAEEIGFPARAFLRESESRFVLLVDDLEHSRDEQRSEVFGRYRRALDSILGDVKWRAGVFFLVNMLEAYYFADTAAIIAVLGPPPTPLEDWPGDVELISHPKNKLSEIFPFFNEVTHGASIVGRLDIEKVLGRMDTCASLRTLFAWCSIAMMETDQNQFCLSNGIYCGTTGRQLASLTRISTSRGGFANG